MASLFDAVARPRVIINTNDIPSDDGSNVIFNRRLPLADAIEKQPETTVTSDVNLSVANPEPSKAEPEPSKVQAILDKLFGLHGQERYQLWPEKLARDALAAPHDVMTGQIPQYEVDPVTGEAHTSTGMIKAAQDVSALAGTGGLAGAGSEAGVALGSGPLKPKLVVARKMPNGEIQIGKSGQIHSDLLNDAELYAGLDKTQGQMGFASPDGKFLSRADALDYANKFEPERAIDANAKGRGLEAVNYNTLLSDSSKPGTAIQAMSNTNKPFYSAVENALTAAKQPKADAQQWLSFLKNQPGVKQEELSHLGLDKLSGSITKDDLLKAVQEGQPQIKEVVKGIPVEQRNALIDARNRGEITTEELAAKVADLEKLGPAKFPSYQLPGATNYREMLLTLPPTKNTLTEFKVVRPDGHVDSTYANAESASARAQSIGGQVQQGKTQTLDGGYKSSHWDEPNVLAHIRMNDRMIDGKKSLHLEEIQSDWMQSHRKELTNLHKEIDNNFDSIADRMVKAGIIKKVCD